MGEIARFTSNARVSRKGYSRNTEAGLSKAQAKAVREREEAHRSDRIESGTLHPCFLIYSSTVIIQLQI